MHRCLILVMFNICDSDCKKCGIKSGVKSDAFDGAQLEELGEQDNKMMMWFKKLDLKLLLICLITIIAGAFNNVGAFMLGQMMPGYPMFLLYWTTFLYSVGFLIFALINKETLWSGQPHKEFLILGIWTTLNGVAFQFACPFVNGEMQQMLAAAILPCTGILTWWKHGLSMTRTQVSASIVIIIGILFGAIPPYMTDQHGANAPGWVLLFLLSIIFQSCVSVWQERLYKPPFNAKPWTTLFWFNFWSMFGYTFFTPLTMLPGGWGDLSFEGMWTNQVDAFNCFFHAVDPLPPQCESEAWVWVGIVFVGAYILYFYLLARLIASKNAYYQAIVMALVTPVSGLILASSEIMGEYQQETTYWTWISLVIIFIGFLFYDLSKPTPSKYFFLCASSCFIH